MAAGARDPSILFLNLRLALGRSLSGVQAAGGLEAALMLSFGAALLASRRRKA